MKKGVFWKFVSVSAAAVLCLSAGLGQTQDAAVKAAPLSAGDFVAGIYGLVSSSGGDAVTPARPVPPELREEK